MGRAIKDVSATGLPGADTQPLLVSIVINYHGLEQTRVCVASLVAADYPNHSVVVVDNASGRLEVDALRETLGNSIEIIRAERNLRMAAAQTWGWNGHVALARPMPGC